MPNLVFVDNNRLVTDSLNVAEIFGKRHNDVLRDIKNLGCSEEFRVRNFAQSSYTNQQGREMPKVIISEHGFAILAMGYTGHRAMEFKEAFIAAFVQMRENLKQLDSQNIVPLDERRVRMELLKTAIDHEERLETIEQRIDQVEQKVEEQITLDSGEQRRLQKVIAKRVYHIAADEAARSEFFRQLYREIKDRWAVPSYKDVRRTELQQVMKYIDAWIPRAA